MAGIKFNKGLSNWIANQSDNILGEYIQTILKNTANEIQKLMTKIIYNYFYKAYKPKYYKRTFALLHSVTQTKIVQKGNNYEITIFLDPSKAGDYDNKGNMVQQHRWYINDFGNLQPVKDDYPQLFDANTVFSYASMGIHGLPQDGKSGWHNNRYIQQSKLNFASKLESEIDTDMLLSEYSKELKKQGFKVEFIR